MKTCSKKEEKHQTVVTLKKNVEHLNVPLMAGGGDSVAWVILLSLPQTGAGCRFETLVSMFQEAGSRNTDVVQDTMVSQLCDLEN